MLQLFRIFAKKLSFSTEVISQTTPSVLPLSEKSLKKTSPLHQCMSDFHPEIFHGFQKKLKNFYIHTYHITDLKQFLRHFHLKSNLPKAACIPPSTKVISQKLPPCVAAFRKNSKNFYPSTTDYQDCHPILLHQFSTFLKKKHNPSTGIISKTSPRCVAAFRKNSKNFYPSTTDYRKSTPFCITLFCTFS